MNGMSRECSYSVGTRPGTVVHLPAATADLVRSEVLYRDGQRRALSQREVQLLCYLATQAGRTVSRHELLEKVWHWNPQHAVTRTVDMHVAKLRHKLRDAAPWPRALLTVHGQGYRLTVNGAAQSDGSG